MWTFVVLYILGLNICQANGEGNSTQMHYVKLTIEKSAIPNITEKLTPFVNNTNLKVDNLEMTTKCQSFPAGTECRCEPDFRWSNKVCQKSDQKCCGNDTCIFTDNSTHMCVSNKRVTLSGSFISNGQEHLGCLKVLKTEEFQKCNNKLLREMKTVYSTLTGFDFLTISKYRFGSIVADFEMAVAYGIKQKDLMDKTIRLSRNLMGSFNLETLGVVRLIMPPKSPVCHYDRPTIRCITEEDLNTQPVWQLKRDGRVNEIFNGTEAVVTTTRLETSVALKNISRLWRGEYTCVYHQKFDSNTISHKTSAEMDISILPNIHITTEPTFPHCRKSSDFLKIKVKCEIKSSRENYTVTWHHQNISVYNYSPFEDTEHGHAVTAAVNCMDSTSKPQFKCTFKNRCNEERSASTYVNIIYEHDQFCEADGEWEDTKAGFLAILKCKNETGQRKRKCNPGPTQATWQPEVSECVNLDVNRAVESANIVDIGLGSLDGNAAGVFSLLERVTSDSPTINTFANMNASVQVLFSLRQRIHSINNETASNNFLESSSNLLEKSLNESWTTTADEGNISLAEQYLETVEHLIQMTNVTHVRKKRNLEVATSTCTQGSQCANTVLNVTVVLKGADPGSVKTAGFKELENYLPHKDDAYEPNSYVVSTTTEKKLDSVSVEIGFNLLKPRRRHVRIKCVSWDYNISSWSTEGCDWQGSSDEGRCICYHLSSFSILMSRYPVHVGGLTEMTYVGLSVSVLSLIICLVIEALVWRAVVKTNTLYLRHVAHINISLSLLIADCCFLASSSPRDISVMWCKVLVVLKHFCYMSMFFWMFGLSSMLLHQAIFLFHNVSKKTYLRLSLVVGYVCPLVIVVSTFFIYKSGAEDVYFSHDTCWLLYTGVMEGSIHTFVIPIGIIVIFNVFSMLVVIMKLLDMNVAKSMEKEKKAAITVMRTVILLTPVFGVTWVFGFAVLLLDLTSGPVAVTVNFVFTLLNSFQGLFILLTVCLGDKLTREALLNRLKKNAPASSTTDSTIKLESTWKK